MLHIPPTPESFRSTTAVMDLNFFQFLMGDDYKDREIFVADDLFGE